MLPYKLNAQITLELLDLRHVDELFAVTDANRAHLRAWLPWVDGTRSAENTREFVRQTQRQWSDNKGFQAAILESGAIVGVIGFHGIDWGNRSTSLGYWLAEAAQGRGIMTEACRSLTHHAFGALALNRVEIRCATENRRSRSVPDRLRFVPEGVLRQAERIHGRFVDHVVYGMLASEWPSGPVE